MMNESKVVIGIDPGGDRCGWAVFQVDDDEILYLRSGVWDLRMERHEGGGMHLVRLDARLCELFAGMISLSGVYLVFERIRFHGDGNPIDAAHVYGEVTGQIMARCEKLNVPYRGIYLTTARKLAVGSGNAKKPEVREWIEKKYKIKLDSGDRKSSRGKNKGKIVEQYDESDAACMALALIEEMGWARRGDKKV